MEGNGNKSQNWSLSRWSNHPLDMLSRWKGMETADFGGIGNPSASLWICFPVWREWKLKTGLGNKSLYFSFGYAFPVEGNGNTSNNSCCIAYLYFGYAFPVEGNGNINCRRSYGLMELVTLDMLSRWKGMETVTSFLFLRICSDFGYAFPVEGNGNRVCQCANLI